MTQHSPHIMPRVFAIGCLLTLAACAPSAELLESPLVEELRQGIDGGGAASFDHSSYDAMLSAHVDVARGRVDYAGFKQDEAALDAYLATLASADVTALGEGGQKALLINAYNAYTLKLILENYPGVESIRDLDDPWGARRYEVAGHTLSLDDIEHGLLRPLYKDERIHFAVNCASIGCPPLRDEAYTGEAVDSQLDAAARTTLSSDKYVRVENETLHVTKILKWYGADFTDESYRGAKENLARYISPYALDEVAAFIEREAYDPRVRHLDYDWTLNDID